MCAKSFLPGALLAIGLALIASPVSARAQDTGPMRVPERDKLPPPMRPAKPEPPPLPPDEIIRRFAAREDAMARAIHGYTFQKEIRVQEIGPDRKPTGEFDVTYEERIAPDGKISEKMTTRHPSTLQHFDLQRGDTDLVAAAPLFPFTTAMIPKYDITYGGKQPLDELTTYYFTVKPRAVERSRAYFSGVIWVDVQDLVIVKTIGKWVTELGDVTAGDLPFTLFETYRQQFNKELWFPAYSRSDEILESGGARIPIRITVKWSDFKPGDSASASDVPATHGPSDGEGKP